MDESNTRHLAAHNVTRREYEFALTDPRTTEIDYHFIDGEERFRFVGMTQEGRLLVGIYTVRAGRIRAVTAFDASKKEIVEWLKHQ